MKVEFKTLVYVCVRGCFHRHCILDWFFSFSFSSLLLNVKFDFIFFKKKKNYFPIIHMVLFFHLLIVIGRWCLLSLDDELVRAYLMSSCISLLQVECI